MTSKKRGQVGPRFVIYFSGLLVMALGIVLLIKANLGATPWDVFHVGLYYQLGLSIGSWSIIAGVFILTASAIIAGEFPKFGAFLNMLSVGVFVDLYFFLPFLQTPDHFFGKVIMFCIGLLLSGYGMGLYISAQFGAGPRDSLMIALANKTGWKVKNVRLCMEVIVLLIGWQLGGPVSWGTIVISLCIGHISGFALPQCQHVTEQWLNQLKKKKFVLESNRGAKL